MNKHLVWASVAMLILIGLAEAQEPEPIFDEKKACPPADECDGSCDFDWTPYYEKTSRLLDFLEGTDFKTVRLEEFPVVNDPRIDLMRETWYVRKDPLSG